MNGMLFTAYVEQFLAPHPGPRRHRHSRQSGLAQGKGGPRRDPQGRRPSSVPAAPASERDTAPTSTRLNSSLPSSSTSCAKPRNEPIQPPGAASAPSSISSPRRSAPITWLFRLRCRLNTACSRAGSPRRLSTPGDEPVVFEAGLAVAQRRAGGCHHGRRRLRESPGRRRCPIPSSCRSAGKNRLRPPRSRRI